MPRFAISFEECSKPKLWQSILKFIIYVDMDASILILFVRDFVSCTIEMVSTNGMKLIISFDSYVFLSC